MVPHRFKIAVSLFLILATFLVFWQVSNHDFVSYDDDTYVTKNPHVQAGLSAESITWAFTTTYANFWHPLTWLSHMLDCQLFGLSPGGHHLSGLLLHMANSILLFLVFVRMTKALWCSAFVAGLGDPEDEHVQQAESLLFELEEVIQKTEGINLKTYVRAQDKFDEANHYMNHKQWEKAIVKFKECLALNKTHPQSYGNMGICYSKLGQKEKAIAALDKALEIDPTYELAMVNRAVIESLKDGEKMEGDSVESIEYVKEYPMKKKSYIQSLIQKIKYGVEG